MRKVAIGISALFILVIAWAAILFLADTVITSQVPVTLPPSLYVGAAGDSYVSATGTWVIEGDKQAFPLQVSKIICEKELKRCSSATAQVMLGKQLNVHLDIYDIIEWGNTRVVFVDNSPVCVRYVYTMDLLTESVNAVRIRRKDVAGGADNCNDLDKQLRLTLRKGFDVWLALEHEAEPWFGRVAAAPLRMLR